MTAAGARPAERWRRTAGAAAGRILEVAAPPGDGWPDAGAAPLVVAAEPDPDFGKAPVLYSRIRSQRDGWLMLLTAIRATAPPAWKVKRRPSPRGKKKPPISCFHGRAIRGRLAVVGTYRAFRRNHHMRTSHGRSHPFP